MQLPSLTFPLMQVHLKGEAATMAYAELTRITKSDELVGGWLVQRALHEDHLPEPGNLQKFLKDARQASMVFNALDILESECEHVGGYDDQGKKPELQKMRVNAELRMWSCVLSQLFYFVQV